MDTSKRIDPQGAATHVALLQEAWAPMGRLSEAFSDRSVMGQRGGPSLVPGSPGTSFGTPPGVTPTSRMGTEAFNGSTGVPPRTSIAHANGLATGDLLTGSPFVPGRLHPLLATPTGTLQARPSED